MEKITIGIICFKEEGDIAPLLDSLNALSPQGSPKNLLIADNSSSSLTEDWIREHSENYAGLNFNFIETEENNLGKSRAALVKACKTPYLAFVDADCQVGEAWLKELWTAYEEALACGSPVAGVCGPNRLGGLTQLDQLINLSFSSPLGHGFSPQAYKPKALTRVNHLPTTNCLYKVESIKSVGSFSEDFPLAGEDLNLGLRLGNSGFALFLSPSPVVINQSVSSLKQWAQRMYKFGRIQRASGRANFAKVVLMFFIFLSLTSLLFAKVFFDLVAVYVVLLVFEGLRLVHSAKKPSQLASLMRIFIVTHVFYALGVLASFLPAKDKGKGNEPG